MRYESLNEIIGDELRSVMSKDKCIDSKDLQNLQEFVNKLRCALIWKSRAETSKRGIHLHSWTSLIFQDSSCTMQ